MKAARLSAFGQPLSVDEVPVATPIDQAMAASPGFSPLQYARKGIVFEHPADLEHVIAGLEKAIAASSG